MIKDSVQRTAFSVQKTGYRNLFSVFCFLVLTFFFLPAERCPLYAEVLEGIVAVVNQEVITRHDLEEYLAPLYFQYQSEYQGGELQRKLKELQTEGLRQLIEEKLLLSEARKRGMTVEDKEVGLKMDQVRARFASEDEFYGVLSQQGLTEDDLERKYRDQLMIGKLIDEEIRYRVDVSPSEIDEYYNTHLEEFNVPEKFKLRNILIRAQGEGEEEEAFIRIHEIAVLLSRGDSFEELAKRYSEGPQAQEGGLMGLVTRGDLLPELEPVVFDLGVGETSPATKSSLGYHLFKLEEKIPSRVKPLAEAQQEIRSRLRKEKTDMRYKSFIGELRAKAYISVKE